MEYQSELKEATKAASILQQALRNVNSNNRFPIMQSPAPGAGVGIIQQVSACFYFYFQRHVVSGEIIYVRRFNGFLVLV